ncbi:type II secretion system F family protein [Nocardioides sp. GY 10113]|uniref:type II secretion system F family protein n=1 Tax=Nocardioides sp. GY 10113 TaxID=2569761 RepID=UPI0010A8E66F|nr:type II secretion system F family protein [Nocardioides sp. GY 10113]TIC88433.1 type II secretion system F family protein [Nocardioides sp. GY 10113]
MSIQYAYKVRDTAGRFKEGKVKAASETAVAEQLLAMGYVPLEVKPAGVGLNRDISFGRKRVTMKDLAVFSRQLATMVDAGLTLMRGLTILADQVENPELRRALHEVKKAVEGGQSLSQAFAADRRTFPPFLVSMARAGEVGGFLDVALKQVAETFEAEVKLRSKIKAAMTYPVVVFCMAILMCIGMLLFVVPIFEGMFADLGGQLPLPTRFLVALSGVVRYGAPIFAALIAAFVWWWRRHAQDDKVREFVDPLKLRMPVFGDLFSKIALTRFSRNLGTLLSSGVPILSALDIVSATTGSKVIEHAVHDVRQSVATGESIAGPLSQHPIFPPMVVQMIASGEESGAVDQMLKRVAQWFEEEVEATTEALTALIEPLMIAFLGVVVGGMIICLYLPMFTIFDLIE